MHSVFLCKCLGFMNLTVATLFTRTELDLSGDGKAEAGNAAGSAKGIRGECLARLWRMSGETPMTPQVTNIAGAGGVLLFTNKPDPTTNNSSRVRSLPYDTNAAAYAAAVALECPGAVGV